MSSRQKQQAPSPSALHTDMERLKNAVGASASDASPFRTAVRNIIAACRNSPVALACYCREGVLQHLATAMQQVCDSSQSICLHQRQQASD